LEDEQSARSGLRKALLGSLIADMILKEVAAGRWRVEEDGRVRPNTEEAE
jgi:hypothetical protein